MAWRKHWLQHQNNVEGKQNQQPLLTNGKSDNDRLIGGLKKNGWINLQDFFYEFSFEK